MRAKRLSDDGDAVEKFMGCPLNASTTEAYNEACPSRHLPLTVPTILACGTEDDVVPLDMVADFYATVQRATVENGPAVKVKVREKEILCNAQYTALSFGNICFSWQCFIVTTRCLWCCIFTDVTPGGHGSFQDCEFLHTSLG